MNELGGPQESRFVIICPPQKSCVRRVLRDLKGKNFGWVYFGEDMPRFLATKTELESKGQRIEIAEMLQEAARSLRQPYINYIGKLSIKNNSPEWWASALSEKNPFVSRVFLYSCYIKVGQQIIESQEPERPLVFLVENNCLRQDLAQNLLHLPGRELRLMKPFAEDILNKLKDSHTLLLKKSFFILNSAFRILIANSNKPSQVEIKKYGERPTFILTWANLRSFDENNNYRDSFFGELPSKLKARGNNVVIVPYVLGGLSIYKECIKKMRQSDEKFLPLESFLKISDTLRIALKELASVPKRRRYPPFEGLEISEIIFNEYRGDWIETRRTALLLFKEVIKNWKAAEIPVDVLILTFENRIREKIINIALKELYPSAYVIGYQHSTVSKMYLDHFFSRYESSILPFPDRLVTNGEYYERLLRESGYDAKKIVCGGAIRYSNLLRLTDMTVSKKDGMHTPTILVTPSISMNESLELVWKVSNAFRDKPQYHIIIKCHPLMPFHLFAKKLGAPLPPHFSVSDAQIEDLVKTSDVLIYTTSTTCVEALALGVPVLHVGSDFIIDMDVLDFKPEIRYSARNKDTIREKIEEALRITHEDLLEKRKEWKKVVSEMFGPVTEQTYDLFQRPTTGDTYD